MDSGNNICYTCNHTHYIEASHFIPVLLDIAVVNL